MKDKSSRLISSARCQHFTPSGRQCSFLVGDRSSGLCPRLATQNATGNINFREALTRESFGFQRAQGVNNSLGVLYGLLAEGSISTRRAAVLAYISSLLLRTLPAIDYDEARFPEDDTEPEDQNQAKSVPAAPAAQPSRQERSPYPRQPKNSRPPSSTANPTNVVAGL